MRVNMRNTNGVWNIWLLALLFIEFPLTVSNIREGIQNEQNIVLNNYYWCFECNAFVPNLFNVVLYSQVLNISRIFILLIVEAIN